MSGIFWRGLALVCAVWTTSALAAAQPVGEFLFAGSGSMLLTFDGAGNISGLIASPLVGLDNIAGTALVAADNSIAGTCTVTDRFSGVTRFTGTVSGKVNGNNINLKLLLPRPQTFTGVQRLGNEPSPSGQYYVTTLPNSLLIQCDRSSDRQLVTVQGDQDYGLDLTQAFGAQLLFNQNGDGFGVAFENGNPALPARLAAGKFFSVPNKLKLTLFQTGGLSLHKTETFTNVATAGAYDGVYQITATVAGCTAFKFNVTIKAGTLTGSSASTGNVSGTMDNFGNLNFNTDNVTVPPGCASAGVHVAGVFVGGPLPSPVFPNIAGGTFTATGVSGTFVMTQPQGITGATTPGIVNRTEIWNGALVGNHSSALCAGAVFNESYTVSLTFPSSLIHALRGGPALVTGTGTMSGSETVKTQGLFPTTVSAIQANTLSGASVNVTFAGVLSAPAEQSIEFSSPTVLIPSNVKFFAGINTGKTLGENLSIVKMRVTQTTATTIKGKWQYGDFFLHK